MDFFGNKYIEGQRKGEKMKAFFEEYGFIVLSAIVVLILIGMATPIGDVIEESAERIVTSLTEAAESKIPE